MVKYAFEHCDFYRDRWGELGFDGTVSDWRDFSRLPELSKDDVRANTDGLIARRYPRDVLVEARTGGSTGRALTVYFDRRCQELRNAAAMRSDQWAGWEQGMKVAAVWGNPPVADTWKKKLRNLLLDRIMYLDTMNLSERTIVDFSRMWQRERPQILFGHSHSLYILARQIQSLGIRHVRPRGIISTSMMLLGPERELIQAVFGVPVTDRYGCEEVSLVGSECERHSGFHLNVDHVVVELIKDDGTEARPGEEGTIVVTDLINHGMPLIRYRLEDLAIASDRICACGRGLPLIERVTGRQADFLKRTDGSQVAGVSLVERTLTAIGGVEQMQIVQNSVRAIRVKIVADRLASRAQIEQAIKSELGSVFGSEMRIDVEFVAGLDQSRNGKYRFTICNV
jgi:phenylacetate-CoA ligase